MSNKEPVHGFNQQRQQSCRRRLQNTFENNCELKNCDDHNNIKNNNDRSILSVLTLNDNTRKVLRNSVERVTKSFNLVRTSIGTLTQKFRSSTRRRQILEEGPMTPNCATPYTFSKQVLGRSPAKLYSPFGIETPLAAGLNNEKRPPRI